MALKRTCSCYFDLDFCAKFNEDVNHIKHIKKTCYWYFSFQFSATTVDNLIRKITSGASPALPIMFSQELTDLLSELLEKKPEERPTASEILARPIIIRCLSNKVGHFHE